MVEFPEDAINFLREEGCLRIATVGPDELPYIAPFAFLWHEEEKVVYILTRAIAKTVRNLRKKPETAILLDRYYRDDPWKNQFCMIRGRATVTEEKTEVDRITALRKEKFPLQGELADVQWSIIRIKPEKVVTFLRERDTIHKKPE